MLTQKYCRDQVALLAHPVAADHPTAGEPKDYRWSLVARFDLNQLHRPPEAWAQDYEDRLFQLQQQKQAHELTWLTEDYLPYPDKQPVIVVQAPDGSYYPWDGSKRIAFACAQNLHRIPAFVGTPY